MASKRETKKAASYMAANRVPKRVMRPEQLADAARESNSTFHDTVSTVARLLQAGSGLGAAPVTRKALERGDIKG